MLLASAIAASLSAPAVAQNVAPPTRDELTVPGERAADDAAVNLTLEGGLARSACALDDAEYADLRIVLDAVRYDGAEAAARVALDQAHAGYLGRELPVSALCEIRDRAAALLEDAGYLAAVEIPPQSLGDRQAEFRVVLGRLVAIRARGDTRAAESVLASYLGQLVGQDVFNTHDVERYLLLANDIPGTEVRLSLRPATGGQPGDLVGEVAVLGRAATFDLGVQNYGSRALGRYGGLARAEVYGLTGLGDRTSITLFSTLDFVEQQTFQLAHDMRVGSEGLAIGGQLTLGWTEPEAIPGFTVETATVFASLDATYPFVRRQRASLWGSVGFDYADQDVRVNSNALTRDRVRTAFAKLRFLTVDAATVARRGGYSPYEPRMQFTGEFELRKGLSIFNATRDCRGAVLACTTGGAVAPARIEQDPTPLSVRGQLAGEFRPTPLLALAAQLRGQFSDEALPSFEEFAGGNYAIGRGYDPAAVLGDSGVSAAFELRYGTLRPNGPESFAFQPFAFTDLTRTWDNDPSQRTTNPDRLWSAGGGVRFVQGNRVQGDLTFAVPLQRTDSQTGLGPVRLLFSLSTRFTSWRN